MSDGERRVPMWPLSEGYPLAEALKLEQRLADINNQVRWVRDLDGTEHKVTPNPESPYFPGERT